MRISDWSSDVCSSDLARSCRADVRQGGHADGGARRLQRDPACRAARGRRVGLHAPRLGRQGAEELAKDLRRRGMTVYVIGAGPGAPDLITLRGRDLIARCPVVLYAGSLVPAEVVAVAPAGARVIDTAPLTLDAIVAEIEAAHAAGHDVARVHSGDPSLYGAIAEQIRRLRALDIAFEIVPGDRESVV